MGSSRERPTDFLGQVYGGGFVDQRVYVHGVVCNTFANFKTTEGPGFRLSVHPCGWFRWVAREQSTDVLSCYDLYGMDDKPCIDLTRCSWWGYCLRDKP